MLVLKLYLRLCRMNVYINVRRRYFKIKKVRNLLSLRDKSIERSDDRLMKIRVFHITFINEEVLLGRLLACRLWFPNKAMDMT